MCFKTILSKMFILVNLFHKMLLLLRSVNDGALLQACEEDQILPGSEIVEWCPNPLLDSHDHVC